LTGVPARTLRRWAEADKVPVVAGQRKRLVRLGDVRWLPAMTGHQPGTHDVTGADAVQATGHMTEGVTGDNRPPSSALGCRVAGGAASGRCVRQEAEGSPFRLLTPQHGGARDGGGCR